QAGGGAGHYPAAPLPNSGDGLRLAEGAGGTIAADFVSAVALAPVSLVPRDDGKVAHFPHLIERAKPGIIAVTAAGRRFVSEADSYHDFVAALIAATPPGQPVEAWLIADHTAQRRWGLGWAKPFPFPTTPVVRSGYLKRERSVEELAHACAIR